jgi:hypothetical protein
MIKMSRGPSSPIHDKNVPSMINIRRVHNIRKARGVKVPVWMIGDTGTSIGLFFLFRDIFLDALQ